MRIVILLVLCLGVSNSFALLKDKKSLLVGNVLKNYLESYHYRPLSVNDDLSNKAFKEFVKRVDYGKQFYFEDDLKKLEKYNSKMDDQMVNGNHSLIIESRNILMSRIKQAEEVRKEIFGKKFDFTIKENLELDPEKMHS